MTTTTEITYRAVYRYDGQEGGSYCVIRSTEGLAWQDAEDHDDALDPGIAGHWAVQVTTTTTTTEDRVR